MNPLILSFMLISAHCSIKADAHPIPSVMLFREYPKIAAVAKDSGKVVMSYGIGPDGHVIDIKLKSGNPRLFRYASWLFEKWEFIPDVKHEGKAFEMTFNFELSDKKEDSAESKWTYPDQIFIKGKVIYVKDNQSGY